MGSIPESPELAKSEGMSKKRYKRLTEKGPMRLPMTVREAQKYLSKILPGESLFEGNPLFDALVIALANSCRNKPKVILLMSVNQANRILAQLASKDPNQVLINANGEVPNAGDGQENKEDEGGDKGLNKEQEGPQLSSSEEESKSKGNQDRPDSCNDSYIERGEGENHDRSETDSNSEIWEDHAYSIDSPPESNNRYIYSSDKAEGNTKAEVNSQDKKDEGLYNSTRVTSEGYNGSSENSRSVLGSCQAKAENDGSDESTVSSSDSLGETLTSPQNFNSLPRDGERPSHPLGSDQSSPVPVGDGCPESNSQSIDREANGSQGRRLDNEKEGDTLPSVSEAGNNANLVDDGPTHQKKWGNQDDEKEENKKEKEKETPNEGYGGVTGGLKRPNPNSKARLLRLCRERLARLTGDSSFDPSPRRDYGKFTERLLTYRNPQPARKEEIGRSVILFLADVSYSCMDFSEETLKVAKAASSLGVPGSDIIVVSHSNGYPEELEVNNKALPIELSSSSRGTRRRRGLNLGVYEEWYINLIKKYQVESVIALGDWDAAKEYASILKIPQVKRFIWLDNEDSNSLGKPVDRTKEALKDLGGKYLPRQAMSKVKYKFTYIIGCSTAEDFVKGIK